MQSTVEIDLTNEDYEALMFVSRMSRQRPFCSAIRSMMHDDIDARIMRGRTAKEQLAEHRHARRNEIAEAQLVHAPVPAYRPLRPTR